MTGMVQTDLVHPTAPKYKDEPVDDTIRHSGHPGSHHIPLQHPRSATLLPHQKPSSPHQSTTTIPSNPYGPPHAVGNSVLHSQTSYGQAPQDPYYTSHQPYTTASTPSQYPSSGPPEIMATTTQMPRPYPPIYHTPQSSSPASVASQTHEQHNRNLYTQSPQIPSGMYGYQHYPTVNPVQPSPYPTHPSPQHPLTSQPLMMTHSAGAQLPHQSSQAPPGAMTSPSTATAQQPTPPQRAILHPPLSAATGGPLSAGSAHHPNSNVGASSSAAPGPIPATTPLVVRQDNNGVQWIAFEYSRDRVKMEYTIRCDVESVNVDNLNQEFKTENCVYPRACCSKDQYRGNRLVYETECNAVGWALADLNPALRGKRGLIQRAVDSWRNSNQDPRLRSRRVRRMAKMTRRQGMPQSSSHMASASPVTPSVPGVNLTAAPGSRPSLGPMTMGPPQLHHHHAQPEGHPNEEVSGADLTNGGANRPATMNNHGPGSSPTDIRTAQVFHGYPGFPPSSAMAGEARGPSIPPLMRDSGIGSLGRHPAVATSSKAGEMMNIDEEDDDECNPTEDALFGTLPDGKRRKFILVEDTQRGGRVRVKVMLDQVDMNEIPDSYRMSNSVYPRSYFPVQMKDPRSRAVPGKRYLKDDTMTDEDETATVGRIMVPAPQLDGEGEIAVPRLSRGRHRQDVMLNDLGYRMSWSQSRVFAGRPLFLQRSLDAYRNKMRSTMLGAGQEPTSIPRHFETRAGKRRFLEHRRRPMATSGRGGMQSLSAAQRSAEEVEA